MITNTADPTPYWNITQVKIKRTKGKGEKLLKILCSFTPNMKGQIMSIILKCYKTGQRNKSNATAEINEWWMAIVY